MAALQITVSGSAQDITALHLVDFDAANTVVFLSEKLKMNDQYDYVFVVGPSISGTTTATIESWE
jgi:hypothetical protein